MRLGLLILIVLLDSPVHGQQSAVAPVTQPAFSEFASGLGKDRNSAIRDALKNAVNQGLGVFVKSTEVLKDGRISEEILTNSNGFIESYEVASEHHYGPQVRVSIHARISSKKLEEDLKSRRIPIRRGAEEVALNLNSKLNKRLFERDRDNREAQLLFRALQGMPDLKSYIRAGLVSVKEVDLNPGSDQFAIRAEMRYAYDWNKILRFNRRFDKFLRLAKISQADRSLSLSYEDVELVARAEVLTRTQSSIERDLEFGKSSPQKLKFEHSDDYFSIPILVDLKLVLPDDFPDSGFESKMPGRRMGWRPTKYSASHRLSGASVDCRWVVHKVRRRVWKQATELHDLAKRRERSEVRQARDDLPIVATAYGIRPYWSGNPRSREFEHYFRDYGHFCDTAPLKITWGGKYLSLPVGETQSIPLSIDDLERPAQPRPKAATNRYTFSSNSWALKPIPWRESVRLTWGDGTPFFQVVEEWRTKDGGSYHGKLLEIRRDGSLAVIQLKGTSENVELPVENLTESSRRRLPLRTAPSK